MTDGGISGTEGSDGEEAQAYTLSRGERILRAAVIIMGVILVVGTIILVVAIIKRASSPSIAPGIGFDDVEVPVAHGSEVTRFELDGNRIAVHVKSAAGNEIVLVDIRRGEVLGRIRLMPKAP